MRSYGLIGYPLGHSFSRQFFTEKFERENRAEQYLNFEIREIGELVGLLAANGELAGLNVTIPYKEQVIPYLSSLDPVAREAGAVNTIRIARCSGAIRTEGFNTDVYGFAESIRPLLQPWHRAALVLGSGGASRAVRHALSGLGIACRTVSRSPACSSCLSYEQLDRTLLEEYTVLVNATPLGTWPDCGSVPPVPFRFVTHRHLLYDLVYNPPETRFLALGKERGALVKNGWEMLVLQALRSYEIWNSGQ